MSDLTKAFNATNTGFTIKFVNGWAVSCHFGRGNYCANRFAKDQPTTRCNNAEIMVIEPDGETQEPLSYQSAADLLAVMRAVEANPA
jgi:hypothetical protein